MVILTENHRQGDDKKFADMLNRIRTGQQTMEDLQTLENRVRPDNHPDLMSDSTKICSTREEASEFNSIRLNKIPGNLYQAEASHFCKNKKQYKPIIKKGGKIADTQFEDIFQFKIGGRVMLIYNISVHDGLCNGAMGTVLAVEETKGKKINNIIVTFDNKETGSEIRKANPAYSKKYPGGTIMSGMEL